MARPTILTEELLLKAREYLGTDKHDKSVLTIEALALELGINRDTVYDWEKQEPKDIPKDATEMQTLEIENWNTMIDEFSDIITRVRLKQADKLIRNGLDGTYNPVITKLLLTKHDYVDRKDITSDDKPLKAALVEFVGDDGNEPENAS